MELLDSQRREADQTVAGWMLALASDEPLTEVFIQSGFTSVGGIEYLRPLLTPIADDCAVRVVVGSNEGGLDASTSFALADLIQPNERRLLGIAAFSNAYFHPKVFMVRRRDGSRAAYVGSANLTTNGAGGRHIEVGMTLDERAGDSGRTFDAIDTSTSTWFRESVLGFHRVRNHSDLRELIELKVIGVPRPRPVVRNPTAAGRALRGLPKLDLLVPPSHSGSTIPRTAGNSVESQTPPGDDRNGDLEEPSGELITWSKKLSTSDAQRKQSGNQRGAVTLTRGTYEIDSRTWFRDVLFGFADWYPGLTRTNKPIQRAEILATVVIDGELLGTRFMYVTHEEGREYGQANLATHLHWGEVRADIADHDYSGWDLTVQVDMTTNAVYIGLAQPRG